MFRVLAIDGGGVRGIYPAHILNLLSAQVPGSVLSGVFDLVIGTSTGAMVASAIACGIPLERVVRLYEEKAPIIFGSKRFTLLGTLQSAYDSAPLRGVLEEIFGEKKMREVPGRLILPATDISNGNVFLIKSPYLPEFVRDLDIRLVDAVMASAAAPLYFDPVRVHEYLLADGGVWANNPSLVAYTEAWGKLGQDPEDVRVLSIGTGTGNQPYDVGGGQRRWGFATGWKRRQMVNLFLNLQSRAAENSATLLLREKYKRISFTESGALPLDEASRIPALKAKAGQTFTYEWPSIKKFLDL
jgi:patatin-like phospholipase/acyl hydrolase